MEVILDFDELANNLELKLFIKYQIVDMPTSELSRKWANTTIKYMDSGYDAEVAGSRAALETFEIDPRIIRKSAADTIEALLALAKKKAEENGK